MEMLARAVSSIVTSTEQTPTTTEGLAYFFKVQMKTCSELLRMINQSIFISIKW